MTENGSDSGDSGANDDDGDEAGMLGDLREQMDQVSENSETGSPEEEEDMGGGEDSSTGTGEGSPGFPFSETRQRPLYPREASWELYEDLVFQVEAELRRSHDIKNLENREVDDAVIRLAEQHPEELVELILEERRDSG